MCRSVEPDAFVNLKLIYLFPSNSPPVLRINTSQQLPSYQPILIIDEASDEFILNFVRKCRKAFVLYDV